MQKRIKKRIRERIKKAREAAGITRLELSPTVGKGEKYINHVESDQNVSIEVLIDIVEATGYLLNTF